MRMIHIDPAHARPFAIVRGDGRFNMHPNNYAILDKNIESTRGNREPKAPRRFHVDKTVPLGNMDRTHHEPSSPSCDWSVRRGAMRRINTLAPNGATRQIRNMGTHLSADGTHVTIAPCGRPGQGGIHHASSRHAMTHHAPSSS